MSIEAALLYPDIPAVSTVAQAAELLGTHPDSLRKAIADGRLEVCRLGRAIRIPRHRLVEFLDAGTASR